MASLFRPTYTVRLPDGRRVKRKAKKWYGQYIGADGRIRRVPLAADRGAAQAMLAKRMHRVER